MRLHEIPNRPRANPAAINHLVAVQRLLDGLAIVLPSVLLTWLEPHDTDWLLSRSSLFLIAALLNVLLLQLHGAYKEAMFLPGSQTKSRIQALSASLGLIWLAGVAFQQGNYLSHSFFSWWLILALPAILLSRMLGWRIIKKLLRSKHMNQRCIILGATASGQQLAEYFQSNADIRIKLLGFVDDRVYRLQKDLPRLPLPLLGNTDHLLQLIRDEQVDQVLVALPWTAQSRVGALVTQLQQLPVHVLLAPDMMALRYAHSRISRLGGLPMFNISELPLAGWSSNLKRLEDLVLGSLMLLLASPVMLLVAIAIKLDSRGPVLFKQQRYGYNNKLIGVYKFRSMYTHMTDANADKQTTKNDARVTRVGRFIRRTSLDELPQFINVVLGSMSLVGPRPHAISTKAAGVLFEEAVETYVARHRVKPGITGWAQINGYRGETDTLIKIQKRVEYDLEYIENWSLWFDLYILARTLPALIFTKEAY